MVAQFPILKSARVAQVPAAPKFRLSECEFCLIETADGKILGRLYSPVAIPLAKDSARKIVDVRFQGRVILFESTYADYRHLSEFCKKSNVAATRYQTNQLLRKLGQRQWAAVTAQPAPAPVKREVEVDVWAQAPQSTEIACPVTFPVQPTLLLMPAAEPSAPDYSSLTRKELAAIAGVKLGKQTKAQLLALISAR